MRVSTRALQRPTRPAAPTKTSGSAELPRGGEVVHDQAADGTDVSVATRRSAEWFTRFFDGDYVAELSEQKPPRQTRREVDFLLRSLRLPRGARILDVACGYGRHAAELSRRGFHVVGLDLSRPMLDEARRRFREGPRLRFMRGDMRRLGYAAEFDAALPRRHWYRAGRQRFILENRSFDPRTKVTDCTQLVVTAGGDGAVQRRFRVQEFSLAEWRRMLGQAGLRLIRAYAGYDGRAYRPASSERLIAVAEKAASGPRMDERIGNGRGRPRS